jgi:phosphate acetyltransferase
MSYKTALERRAKSEIKSIILPETDDPRILKAASTIDRKHSARIILIGEREKVEKKSFEYDLCLQGIEIINPAEDHNFAEYVQDFIELRKPKTIDKKEAEQILTDNKIYFAAMLLRHGRADGLVAGATVSSADIIRIALQVIKLKTGCKFATTILFMELPQKCYGADGLFVFADTVMVLNPDAEEMAYIAINAARIFKNILGKEPKVAMLSYSTFGSGKGESVEKVTKATRIVREREPGLLIEGEIQFDTAVNSHIAALKGSSSRVAGNANVFIFPCIDAGNIALKITEQWSKGKIISSLVHGLSKPMNDLSRGCDVETIISTVHMTCIQSQLNL